MKKLYKSRSDRELLGVLGGLAKYLEVDSTMLRVIFILGALFVPELIGAYFLFALFIPYKNKDNDKNALKGKSYIEKGITKESANSETENVTEAYLSEATVDFSDLAGVRKD